MIPGFWWRWMAWAGCLAAAWGLHAQAPARGVVSVPEAERVVLEEEAARLFGVMFELLSTPGVRHELLPDVAIFHKAVDWSLRFDEFQHTNEIAEAHRMLQLGMERAEALRAGRPDWLMRTGLVVRGYMSRVDGSIQPYGVVVGGGYRPGGRLDVWLHGRDEKLTELRFLRERMKSVGEFAPEDAVVVHPYGRFCNAFKFAGETDVMEAMEHATRAYGADPGRRAIRGFSMGGGGTWHLAAHHPGLWRAAAPGAGFAETAEYTGILKKEPELPVWEQRLWSMYNATDYAANLRQVPLVAYSGEKDRQIQAAQVMERALRAEGLTLDHIIGPGVEHKYEPAAKREVARRVDGMMSTPSPEWPALDLTTHTLRFPAGEGSVWARFEGLKQHWERARLRARVEAGNVIVVDTMGVTAFSLRRPPGLLSGAFAVKVDGQQIPVSAKAASAEPWHFDQRDGRWQLQGGQTFTSGKRPGLQGPIDDAFMDAFIVVVPTGPASGPVDAWVDRQWRQFTKDWRGQFRGECRVVKDVDVTAEDLRDHHVVVWGTPQSNRLLARMARKLPLRWEGERIRHGQREVARGNVVPVLIAPNPLSSDRYVVVNSGHTFAAWTGTNARQTPRLPDWTVLVLEGGGGSRVVEAGFFDEDWR
jgi:dienelactone hydrolase